MELQIAADRFGALAQSTRLEVLKELVKAGPDGVPAGVLAEKTGVPASTLSFHLKELSRTGLAISERKGRHIHYKAHYLVLSDLISFLMNECCQGDPKICGGDLISKSVRA